MSAAVTASTYVSRHTRQRRRTKSDMDRLRGVLYLTLHDDHPMTVRQLFYRLVSEGVIEKTETEYKATVIRLLTQMRRAGAIPYGWIADNTRWMRKPRTHSSLEAALQITAETYRRALWGNQDAYVEVWLEKDALAGVLYEITAEWDVPLMVTRGYPSLTFLHSAAEAIAEQERAAFLYYFGDHDPSGVHIPERVETDLRHMAPEADLSFERVAVTPEQIAKWNLTTRPTKKTDTRARKFKGESVEVDAIPPDRLRALARHCITRHLDRRQLEETERIEDLERQTLESILKGYRLVHPEPGEDE